MSEATENTAADDDGAEVGEFQGLYGAYHVSETLLQKVWLRREFDLSRARLASGERVGILHPGAWNRLAGPDFRGAKLMLGDRVVTGDVEVHFRAEAWTQHGHHHDPAYEDVVLHVVLFPPSPDSAPVRTRSGRMVPLLVLVDLLWHDLEEYASDEAVAALSGRDPFPLLEELLARPEAERMATLHDAAARRWGEKVHFARRRIEKLGWQQACHVTTLEILGYRANRVAMLRVGEHYPWSKWRLQLPTLDELVAVAAEWWTLRGVRPANQPRLRLIQYLEWSKRVPDWMDAGVRDWKLPEVRRDAADLDPTAMRRQLGLPQAREAIARDVCGSELGGTRLDTWICNLLLPFCAAGGGDAEQAFVLWRAWYPGDAPEPLLAAAGQLGLTRSNGAVQALLGLQLARLARSLADARTGRNP